MDKMNIESVVYILDEFSGKKIGIQAIINGIDMSVPLNPANGHYSEIMRQVKAGTLVIEPADEPPPQEEP